MEAAMPIFYAFPIVFPVIYFIKWVSTGENLGKRRLWLNYGVKGFSNQSKFS
jgi:hypothetical protein